MIFNIFTIHIVSPILKLLDDLCRTRTATDPTVTAVVAEVLVQARRRNERKIVTEIERGRRRTATETTRSVPRCVVVTLSCLLSKN